MRTDERLKDLIKAQLRDAVMATRLTGVETLRLDELTRSKKVFKRAWLYNWTWFIRLPVGRATVIGMLRPYEEQKEKAIRYADMVTLYFWKYRIRGASAAPPESEFNISSERAALDLKNEHALVLILKQTEAYLCQLSVLPNSEQLLAKRTEDIAKRAGNISRFKQLEAKLDVIAAGIAELLLLSRK